MHGVTMRTFHNQFSLNSWICGKTKKQRLCKRGALTSKRWIYMKLAWREVGEFSPRSQEFLLNLFRRKLQAAPRIN